MSKAIISCEVEVEVPFYDVDLMEIVWHGNYAKYFEVSRCALLDKIGYDYMAMRASGYIWPIIDLNIRYVKPAKFGQILVVSAGITEWENRLRIIYQVKDKNSGQSMTKGYTHQVAVSIASGEMCYESPQILWDKLGLVRP